MVDRETREHLERVASGLDRGQAHGRRGFGVFGHCAGGWIDATRPIFSNTDAHDALNVYCQEKWGCDYVTANDSGRLKADHVREAADLDAKGVTPQTPTHEQEPKPTGRQRPGGRGVKKPCMRRVPAPPKVSRKNRKPVLWLVALVLLVVLVNLQTIVAALLYVLVVLAGTVLALAAGYANGRWLVPGAYRLAVRLTSRALEARRARPTLPLVPDEVVMPQAITAAEQAQLEAAWMPQVRNYEQVGRRVRRKA